MSNPRKKNKSILMSLILSALIVSWPSVGNSNLSTENSSYSTAAQEISDLLKQLDTLQNGYKTLFSNLYNFANLYNTENSSYSTAAQEILDLLKQSDALQNGYKTLLSNFYNTENSSYSTAAQEISDLLKQLDTLQNGYKTPLSNLYNFANPYNTDEIFAHEHKDAKSINLSQTNLSSFKFFSKDLFTLSKDLDSLSEEKSNSTFFIANTLLLLTFSLLAFVLLRRMSVYLSTSVNSYNISDSLESIQSILESNNKHILNTSLLKPQELHIVQALDQPLDKSHKIQTLDNINKALDSETLLKLTKSTLDLISSLEHPKKQKNISIDKEIKKTNNISSQTEDEISPDKNIEKENCSSRKCQKLREQIKEKDEIIKALEEQLESGHKEKDEIIKALEEQLESERKEKNEIIKALEEQLESERKEKDEIIKEREEQKPIVNKFEIHGDYIQTNGNVGIGKNEGSISGNAKTAGCMNEATRQDLAAATAEIQKLLDQLSKTNPTETPPEKMMLGFKAMAEIEKDPTLKQKIINALKAMSVEAFMEAINHPLANVLRAAIEAYREPQ